MIKKILRITTWVVVLLVAIAFVAAITFAPPVMSGMAAKTVCSCVYLTGRPLESVKQKELQVFPFLDKASIQLHSDSSVTASILWKTSKAIYRKGLGCTLLLEQPEEVIRAQKINLPSPPVLNQDTIDWPLGNRLQEIYQPIDNTKLNQTLDEAFTDVDPANPKNTHAVIAVYNGQLIVEKYAPGIDRNTRLMGWSMTKSISNALMGILVRDEKLSLLDHAPIDEWQLDDRKNIRLEHLLQATTGLAWNESYFNPFSDFHIMFSKKDDKAGYAASRKLEVPPGERFEYSGAATNILSRIIRQTVGEDHYHKFPYERLFYKAGMYSAILEPDGAGTFVLSSYCYASARDWARFGLLYLNDGMAGPERILPEGWVEYSTTPSKAAKRQEYGAQIWLNYGERDNPSNVEYPGVPNEAIIFDGFEKNYVVIIPSKNLVVVRLGVTHNKNFSLANLVNGIIAV
jgi:CubicO group peptidase (beta-lactamase class C family)